MCAPSTRSPRSTPRARRRWGKGSLGAGTGATCFGFTAGVGTASRITESSPTQVLGALVVANYGWRRDLHLLLGPDAGPASRLAPGESGQPHAGGSVIVYLATDAALSERQLRRLAGRAGLGLARAGSFAASGSGEYVIVFSTAPPGAPPLRAPAPALSLPARRRSRAARAARDGGRGDPRGGVNSLCMADAMGGRDGHRRDALPYELLGGLPRA